MQSPAFRLRASQPAGMPHSLPACFAYFGCIFFIYSSSCIFIVLINSHTATARTAYIRSWVGIQNSNLILVRVLRRAPYSFIDCAFLLSARDLILLLFCLCMYAMWVCVGTCWLPHAKCPKKLQSNCLWVLIYIRALRARDCRCPETLQRGHFTTCLSCEAVSFPAVLVLLLLIECWIHLWRLLSSSLKKGW